eukprot:GHVL01030874.1.p1 GENE.GHVL01030874.1~~GHVL01030874.1.p1  ORF type:complete len:296 (+),score=28.59 GHVL01030874.1:49-936(+)
MIWLLICAFCVVWRTQTSSVSYLQLAKKNKLSGNDSSIDIDKTPNEGNIIFTVSKVSYRTCLDMTQQILKPVSTTPVVFEDEIEALHRFASMQLVEKPKTLEKIEFFMKRKPHIQQARPYKQYLLECRALSLLVMISLFEDVFDYRKQSELRGYALPLDDAVFLEYIYMEPNSNEFLSLLMLDDALCVLVEKAKFIYNRVVLTIGLVKGRRVDHSPNNLHDLMEQGESISHWRERIRNNQFSYLKDGLLEIPERAGNLIANCLDHIEDLEVKETFREYLQASMRVFNIYSFLIES